MIIKKTLIALVLTLLAAPGSAQDYVVNVHGIVCGFCSLGVAKKVAKLPFIDKSRLDNGVKVDIKSQMVTIAVKEGLPLDTDALFAAIESGGYDPIEIYAVDANGMKIATTP